MNIVGVIKRGNQSRILQLGFLNMTNGVAAWIDEDESGRRSVEINKRLTKHASGDWGKLDKFDKDQNEKALESGGRILSAYKIGGTKIWIITEADRRSTTILFPSEY